MEKQVTQQQEFVAPSQQVPVTPGQIPQDGNYYQNPEGPRYDTPTEFDQAMQNQVPQQPGVQYNVPDFEAMRREALARAVEQVAARRSVEPPTIQPPIQPQSVVPNPPQPRPESEVVYVRRNLTLAELILVFALSIGMVTGVQFIWQVATDILPRIEIRDK